MQQKCNFYGKKYVINVHFIDGVIRSHNTLSPNKQAKHTNI